MYAGKGLILNHVFGQIEADVYGHADTYMMIVNASIPFLALYNAGAAIFRSIGNSNISMRVSLIMNGINVVGNAILIYVCKCGTEGVAIPTLVSRLAAAVIMIILLIPKKSAQAKQDSTRIYIKKSLHYRANWHMLKSILLVGPQPEPEQHRGRLRLRGAAAERVSGPAGNRRDGLGLSPAGRRRFRWGGPAAFAGRGAALHCRGGRPGVNFHPSVHTSP